LDSSASVSASAARILMVTPNGCEVNPPLIGIDRAG
jgi:hypothetical protein